MGLFKGELLSIRGIIGIVSVVLCLVGAITYWAAFNGAITSDPYLACLLFFIAVGNLLGYLFGLPFAFAVTATFFFIVGPGFIDSTNTVRLTNKANSTNNLRTRLAGGILLLIGAPLSFATIPSDKADLNLGLNIAAVIVVAVFNIISGILFADLKAPTLSAQVFIILFIFAAAVIFGSVSLHYAAGVIACFLVVGLLTPVLPKGANSSKTVAAFVLGWIGCLIIVAFVFYIIQIVHNANDDMKESSGSKKEQPASA